MSERKEFKVELYVEAVHEQAVWLLLRKLTAGVEGAGLMEEPEIREVNDDE